MTQRKRQGQGARFLLRLMDAATSTRSVILAPLLLAGSVAAGLITGSAETFRTALAAAATIWGLSVAGGAARPRPGEQEDVFMDRGRILAEVSFGVEEAARRLLDRAQQRGRRGRPVYPVEESGYDPGEWNRRAAQLARIYELADAVEREYGGRRADPSDAAAMLALPELPRQIEKAVQLSRRRVTVLQTLYSTNTAEIAGRLEQEEREATEAGISATLRDVRVRRAALTRRELETYRRLLEERETIDALLDSIESFLRRLSFRGISTTEIQDQIAEIDYSLTAHDQAMEELREEIRRATGAGGASAV